MQKADSVRVCLVARATKTGFSEISLPRTDDEGVSSRGTEPFSLFLNLHSLKQRDWPTLNVRF